MLPTSLRTMLKNGVKTWHWCSDCWNKGLVTGGTVNTAITNAVNTATSNINSGIETKLNGKANINASNLTNENVKEWTSKLGVGTVGQGDSSNGLVTGKSVYEAIHKYTPKGLVQTDGKVVTVDKSGTANQIDFSGTDKNGNSILREITGVITNPNDPNSVVNMDTLQSQTQGLNQKLTKAVNVGTATASALAALHPLDYDEANKVSLLFRMANITDRKQPHSVDLYDQTKILCFP